MNNILVQLLQERGITKYKLSKETGLPPSSITDWTKNGRQPNAEKLAIVAEYLGVSVDFLLGKETEKPAVPKDDGLSYAEEEFIKMWRMVSEEQKKVLSELIISDLKSKGLL